MQRRICTLAARGGPRAVLMVRMELQCLTGTQIHPPRKSRKHNLLVPSSWEISIPPQPHPSTNDTWGATGKNTWEKKVLHFQKFLFFLHFPPFCVAVCQEVFKLLALVPTQRRMKPVSAWHWGAQPGSECWENRAPLPPPGPSHSPIPHPAAPQGQNSNRTEEPVQSELGHTTERGRSSLPRELPTLLCHGHTAAQQSLLILSTEPKSHPKEHCSLACKQCRRLSYLFAIPTKHLQGKRNQELTLNHPQTGTSPQKALPSCFRQTKADFAYM